MPELTWAVVMRAVLMWAVLMWAVVMWAGPMPDEGVRG